MLPQWEQPNDHDLQIVEAQLGRRPGGVIGVAARCRYGQPQVVASAPLRVNGRSVDALPEHDIDRVAVFPTLYWLTCPLLREAIGRLESTGWIARIKEELHDDPTAQAELRDAHARTARVRRSLLPEATLERLEKEFPGQYHVLTQSGVAGMRDSSEEDDLGVKCLHAHFADYLAEKSNRIGRRVWALLTQDGVDPRGSMDCAGECRSSCADHQNAAAMPQAVIDVGSNSVRLLVAARKNKTWEPLAVDLISTRLAQGVGKNGELSASAINRTVQAVGELRERAATFGAIDPLAVGTSALREAKNSGAFLVRAWEEAGVSVRVISGDEEGKLSFLGATHNLGIPAEQDVLLCDIGGGSTELIVGNGGGESHRIMSLPIGAVRIKSEVEKGRSLEECLLELRRAIEQSRQTLQTDDLFRDKPGVIVAVGGTATTLAALDQELTEYNAAQINGYQLSQERLQEWMTRLGTMALGQRMALPGMPQGRADIIPFGLAILTTILNVWEACVEPTIIVSDSDLLQGIVLSYV